MGRTTTHQPRRTRADFTSRLGLRPDASNAQIFAAVDALKDQQAARRAEDDLYRKMFG